MQQTNMKTLVTILEKILFALLIVVILLSTCVFSYFIQKQSCLDMKELEKIVEKEINEYHTQRCIE